MDSGLGSDEDRQGRTTTKEQKQLHNQRLLSGCFIDASSLTDDGAVSEQETTTTTTRRRSDERRQGALIFQTSIPQFSMLQMSSSEDNFPIVPSASCSSMTVPPEPNTPFNSIVQLETKSPLGFYVDLSEVPDEPPPMPQTSNNTRKNIFSMVIDFEAPKKDMPTRLSSSLIAKRKVRDKKPNSNATSSSSSLNGDSFNLTRNGEEPAARNSSSSSLCSNSNIAEGNCTSASDINDIVRADDDVQEVEQRVDVREKEENEQKGVVEATEAPPQKEVENAGGESQVRNHLKKWGTQNNIIVGFILRQLKETNEIK